MKYIKIANLILALTISLESCFLKEGDSKDRAAEPTPIPSDEARKTLIEKKLRELNPTELNLGWKPEKTLQILQECTIEIDSSLMGKLDTRISQYRVHNVIWWGVSGNLTVEFVSDEDEMRMRGLQDESFINGEAHYKNLIQPGTSRVVQWEPAGLTLADVKVLAAKIDNTLDSKGSNQGGLIYSWDVRDREYSLVFDGRRTIFDYVPKQHETKY